MYGRFEQEDLRVNARLEKKQHRKVHVFGTFLKEISCFGKCLSF